MISWENIPIKQQNVLAQFREAILKRCKPEQIIVFGSTVSPTDWQEKSDIDAFILVTTNDDIRVTRKLLCDVSMELMRPLDLFVECKNVFYEKAKIGGVHQIAFEDGLSLYP